MCNQVLVDKYQVFFLKNNESSLRRINVQIKDNETLLYVTFEL